MWQELKRICELQPAYSSKNTPAMQERGKIIREQLRPAIEGMQGQLAPLLGPFGQDFLVEASDGVGRKTELPWVRFASESMSPAATEGFYFVVHFSTDGSAVHLTIGSGSSKYKGGSFVERTGAEIDANTAWARSIILEGFGTLSPFVDEHDFGARRPLPKSFERATVVSKKIPFDDLETTDFETILRLAAERLRTIYEAQSSGRDVAPADQDEVAIEAIINPNRSGGRRQGWGLPAPAKRAVELRAMELARQHLEEDGFEVKDRSAKHPFDLEASKDGATIKVEVKGTTSDRAEAILMTRNEVDLHAKEKGSTCLIIVSRIRLQKCEGEYEAEGGDLEALMGWDIDEWSREPTAFRVIRPVANE